MKTQVFAIFIFIFWFNRSFTQTNYCFGKQIKCLRSMNTFSWNWWFKGSIEEKVFSIHSFNLIYFHSCNTMSMIRKGTFKSFLHCLSLWTLNPFQHVLLNWQDVVFDATWVRQILMFNFHVKFLRSPKCLTYSHFLITKNFTFCRPYNLATHVLFFSSSHFCSHFNSTIYNIMILL